MNLELLPKEREALRPPEQLTVSEWADRHRYLDEMSSGDPGRWRTSRTPYLRGIMDAWTDPDVEEVTVMKAVQLGVTEAGLNCCGYTIDQDPGPLLYVMQRKDDYEYVSQRRLKPMVESCPVLRGRQSPHRKESKRKEWLFDRMVLFFGAAESPSDLTSRPIRYLICDEMDHWPDSSGREGDPFEAALGRTATFWNRKVLKLSSPTTAEKYIAAEYEKSDRRRHWVPCPLCGRFQILAWDHVRFDERDPDVLARDRLAWYECAHCERRIEDTERNKQRMLAGGVWVPEAAKLRKDGRVVGDPKSSHRGFHLSGLYSPWRTWSKIAAKHVQATRSRDPRKLQIWVNQELGEVFEERSEEVASHRLREHELDYGEGEVPDGAILLTGGVDVQIDHYWYTIRAWGLEMTSWLVRAGRVESWGALEGLIPLAEYGGLPIALGFVDSSYRTLEVYDWCLRWQDVLRPVMGRQLASQQLYTTSRIQRHWASGKPIAGGLTRWTLNPDPLKSQLARLISTPAGEPGGWWLHRDVPEWYFEQMASERRVFARPKRPGERGRWSWRKKAEHAANHIWDCEYLALAAAHVCGVQTLREEDLRAREEAAQARRQARQRRREEAGARSAGGSRQGEPWVRRRPGRWI